MPYRLTLLFLALAVATAPAQEPHGSLPSWNDAGQKAWWAKYPTPDQWPQAARDLTTQLEAFYQQNGVNSFSNADFQGWMEHLEWIRLGLDCPNDLSGAEQLKTFVALGQDDTVSHLFVEKIKPEDVAPAALQNLLRLAQASADDLHEYAALGVAFSLVFDQPFPDDWPHRQVNRDAVPIGDLDVVTRFRFYVQSNRDKKLELDPTRLSFENLKFLVDSKVSLSELAYAQKNSISYSHFADAFFAIKYDDARIGNAAAVYNWPYPTYTLQDIEKNGGICIDQAYYAETLGKGRGIPTIQFTGYGMDGAHAWFGYLSSSGKWELDCGRYEDQNFPKGFATDPQTWSKIDDATLEHLFKNGAQDPSYPAAMTALAWARLQKDDAAAYKHILDDARSIMPEWSETWRMQEAVVEASGDLEKKKAFYQDWVNEFSNYPEMKVEGQEQLYRDLRSAGDSGADDLLKDIIAQNRSEGFDFGISAGADALNEKLKQQDWDGARMEYERTIRDFGEQGGLTLYSKIVYPYITLCLQNNRLDLADSAVTFTEDRMTIDPQSQVGQDFTELKNEVTARKLGH